ncbi:CocE/NonD family hydrolase [Pseudomonas putida]|uniref:CocE/NonD family hydrolase n=1 Tax=Pseudomonas putida TaxID=303 RepID=UPI003570CE17
MKNKHKIITSCTLLGLTALFIAGYNTYVAEDESYNKTSQYVSMPDGTQLAVDIYTSKDTPKNKALPVIFQYTPYGRAYVIPNMKWYEKLYYKYATGLGGSVADRANSNGILYGSTREQIKNFLSNGYAYVIADMRGTGASFGHKTDFTPQLGKDGAEIINWIARQDWSNGNVGMFGGSYLGYSQLVTAGHKPKALKAISPEVVPLDGFSGEIRPGGVALWAYSTNDVQFNMETNSYSPDDGVFPTAPVVDEDGDGDIYDEIPLDLNQNGSFLDDYDYPNNPADEPRYADGQPRKHIYYLASKEHSKNVPYNEIGPNTPFIDTNWVYLVDGESKSLNTYSTSPSGSIKALMESGIPIFNRGGWMDIFVRGTFELYSTMKLTNPSKIMIDAGYHEERSPFWSYFGEDEDKMLQVYKTELVRFFDHYLKGVDNGVNTDAPILIYNMNGDGWRKEHEWPLARQTTTALAFAGGGKLQSNRSTDGTDKYVVDYTHDARWGTDYPTSRWQMYQPDEMPMRTELDKKSLTYTTDALTKDTEVTGHPIVDIWVSSTADNGDFFVYLEDVDADGKAVLVTENALRAGFSGQYDSDLKINRGRDGIQVLPKLPWSGFEKAQYDEKVFADGKVVHLKLDLLPTSWVFKKGHRIRVSVAGSDYPNFEVLKQLSPSQNPSDPNNIVPTITMYRDSQRPSGITLPIIPRN